MNNKCPLCKIFILAVAQLSLKLSIGIVHDGQLQQKENYISIKCYETLLGGYEHVYCLIHCRVEMPTAYSYDVTTNCGLVLPTKLRRYTI